MNVVLFCHSLLSDWNHGNAHFLRGIARELIDRGHQVEIYEPANGWSLSHLRAEYGEKPLKDFAKAYPSLRTNLYQTLDLKKVLKGADLVLVHEWNEPDLVARIGQERRCGHFSLFFHDTHHRAVTAPEQMRAFDLRNYDGVLAYGRVLTSLYRKAGKQAWTWHEAADIRIFRPINEIPKKQDVIWIGNWGDEERSAEIREFFIEPVKTMRLRARVHGVRYPDDAREALADAGIEFGGWIANFDVPKILATSRMTVHVPRRPYVETLAGIPTIRPFEALACGIPLVSSFWNDVEGLFTPGKDYLVARNGQEMKQHLLAILKNDTLAADLASHGLETIRSRHTCSHRVDELLQIYGQLRL
jgi:spore maturation protein CgeB